MSFPGTSWEYMGTMSTLGKCGDIGVGADGSVYVCSNFNVFAWGGGGNWIPTHVSGIGVAVGPDGDAWTFTEGEVRRIRKGVFDGTHVSCHSPVTYLDDIGVGTSGCPWLISNAEGMSIFSGNPSGSNWCRQGGYGTAISVGDKPWHVGSEGRIYFWNERNNWSQVGGIAHDIGIGANGHVWHIGNEDRIYYMAADGNWIQTDGAAQRIAVETDGTPWVMNAIGGIYRRV